MNTRHTGRDGRRQWLFSAGGAAALLALLSACGPSGGGDTATNDAVRAPGKAKGEHLISTTVAVGISPETASVPWDTAQAQTLAALGASVTRIQFCNWPQSASYLDQQVKIATDAGLSVLAEINYCTVLPPGVASLDAMSDADRQHYWHDKYTDGGNAFAQQFAAAAGDIAAHFGSRVSYYEIWNEPDAAPQTSIQDSVDYAGPADADWDDACGKYLYGVAFGQGRWAICPKQLGVLTTNAYLAIKQKSSSAQVIAGNLLFHGDGKWVPKHYWRQVMQSPAVQWFHVNKAGSFGAAYPWDHVGIHPYNVVPGGGGMAAELQDFRGYMGDDGARLAITEVGWTTSCPGGNCETPEVSEATHAQYLTDTFQAAADSNVSLVMWFNYHDNDQANMHFGLRTSSRWKPAADAFCQLSGASACPTGKGFPGPAGGGGSSGFPSPAPTATTPPPGGPPASAVWCGALAQQNGWQKPACEKNGNGACGGVGPATSGDPCDHCCDTSATSPPPVTPPPPSGPPASAVWCGALATQNGWANPMCEKNGNGACGGVGPATSGDPCDHCCDKSMVPAPSSPPPSSPPPSSPPPSSPPPPSGPPASAVWCGALAQQSGWQNPMCEKNGNGACGGVGPATSGDPCDHCCDKSMVPPPPSNPPPASAVWCGVLAQQSGWQNPMCEVNGNGACGGVGPATSGDPCDHCCDKSMVP